MFWPRANAKVAAPVIPGRLRRTPQWCSGTFGPAPTRLMSPSSTFSSCGSSSSFHLRRNNPIQVNCSLLFVATAERAASTRWHIVRNFRIVNVVPSLPIRSCKKSIGPGDVTQTAKATTNEIGTVRGREMRMQATSKKRFAPERDHLLGSSDNSWYESQRPATSLPLTLGPL
jgi:hypothetical protein